MILRPYQTDAVRQMNTLLNASRAPVNVAPTGTGKSRTIAAVIADRIRLNRRVFLLVPTDETFQQWIEELVQWGVNPGTIDQRGIGGRGRMIYVCMYKSLQNLLPYIPESFYPDEIAIDEMHHFPTATIEAIHDYFPRARWFGCTATLWRLDGKGFDHIFTDIVETITMKEAIAAGFLAKPLVVVPKLYMDKVQVREGDYDPAEQAAALGKPQIIGDVIENYGHIFAGKQVLVACCSFDHARDMAEEFRKVGWRFEHIHGNLPKTERRRMIRQLRDGTINGLTTYAVGTEGANIVGLHGLIWLRRTTSLSVYLQYFGRCLRPMKGKDNGIIVDPVGNLFIHGFPETPRQWTLQGRADTGGGDPDPAAVMRICPFCGVANAAVNHTCHFCGGDLESAEAKEARKRKLPAMVDGELVAVESDGQAEEIRLRAERIRAEQAAQSEKEAAARETEDAGEEAPVEMADRARLLRKGLFAERRKLFRDAVENYF